LHKFHIQEMDNTAHSLNSQPLTSIQTGASEKWWALVHCRAVD